MNDKELLELAAKAQGWIDFPNDPIEAGEHWFEEPQKAPFGIRRRKSSWNPLTADADAFRLAVKLEMDIEITIDQSNDKWVWVYLRKHALTESCGNDPYAATRRAIVRTAAQIGRGME